MTGVSLSNEAVSAIGSKSHDAWPTAGAQKTNPQNSSGSEWTPWILTQKHNEFKTEGKKLSYPLPSKPQSQFLPRETTVFSLTNLRPFSVYFYTVLNAQKHIPCRSVAELGASRQPRRLQGSHAGARAAPRAPRVMTPSTAKQLLREARAARGSRSRS